MAKRTELKDKISLKGGEFKVGVKSDPKIKTSSTTKEVSQVDAKKKEIAQDRSKVIAKYKKDKSTFPVIHVESDEQLNWISKEMAGFFGFESCGMQDKITAWDFPHSISNKFKRHIVFREYSYKHIMVDVFDKGTPIKEIKRIKAHLENLGKTYTYIVGGEPGDMPMEKYMKLVFGKRLEKSPESLLKKFQPPQTLAEAGFSGHATEMR